MIENHNVARLHNKTDMLPVCAALGDPILCWVPGIGWMACVLMDVITCARLFVSADNKLQARAILPNCNERHPSIEYRIMIEGSGGIGIEMPGSKRC